ncbi:unnamed protein product [Lactuca virosa]|uniref:Uncharacterized protein n=1 Tax=Lactuca virosa TaxID=75947 RepID=A0AAU9N149_9ASTR|nr:unnamed protein product [Lactuca virosa]
MKTTRTKLDVNVDDVDDQSENDDACQSVSPIRPTTFMSGFAQFANTPSRKKRKDYAQLVSTTNIIDLEHRQGFGSNTRVAFMNAMQGVAMEVPSVQRGTTFGTTRSHVILGDGSGSNFVSWTPQTSCMAEPTAIFHPSWNITYETSVMDSTYSSDFISNVISNVFPQVTFHTYHDLHDTDCNAHTQNNAHSNARKAHIHNANGNDRTHDGVTSLNS